MKTRTPAETSTCRCVWRGGTCVETCNEHRYVEPPPLRSLFVVITTQNAAGDTGTTSHTLTVPAGTSHEDLLVYVMTECVPEHRRAGFVLHYSVHPAVIA